MQLNILTQELIRKDRYSTSAIEDYQIVSRLYHEAQNGQQDIPWVSL